MISVIIPILNEADIIQTALCDLICRNERFEVIVSDGGSLDGTLDIVNRFPEVKQVHSQRGRSRQMNEGAKAAQGDIYLFLHADTRLPQKANQLIRNTLSDFSIVGGSFYLSFDHSSFCLKIYSLFSRINHSLFTYGDQGLFLRAEIFKAIGGFMELPIMEDVEIQRRLRSLGKFVKIPKPVVTSSRRFVNNGIIRQQLLNITLVLCYHLGLSPAFLKRYYK